MTPEPRCIALISVWKNEKKDIRKSLACCYQLFSKIIGTILRIMVCFLIHALPWLKQGRILQLLLNKVPVKIFSHSIQAFIFMA